MRLENMYQEVILDHYQHPNAAGLRDPFDAEVHHFNTSCGDEVRLRVRLDRDEDDPTIPTKLLLKIFLMRAKVVQSARPPLPL